MQQIYINFLRYRILTGKQDFLLKLQEITRKKVKTLPDIFRFDSSCVAFTKSLIVKFASANETSVYKLYLFDHRGVKREYLLNAVTARELSDCYCRSVVVSAVFDCDDIAFENLDTNFFTFDDTSVNFDFISRFYIIMVDSSLLIFKFLNNVGRHFYLLQKNAAVY